MKDSVQNKQHMQSIKSVYNNNIERAKSSLFILKIKSVHVEWILGKIDNPKSL
jgi:hypothetical protein